jgi:Outer membrane protein beta-barrel domain
MRNPKFCLTVCCLVLFTKTLFSQNNLSEGYYVGFKKDTVHGFFNFDDLFFNKIVFYETNTSRTPKLLLPDNIQQIETLDKISIRTCINTYKDKTESIFVSKFADGDVALYRGKSRNLDEDELYFISSVKLPEIRKITKTNPKAFLNTYFKGCELNNFASVRYTQNSILLAVIKITKCAYPDKEIVKKTDESYPIKVVFGVKSGIFLNFAKTEYLLDNRPIKSNVQPVLGLIALIDMSNSTKIYTGINYFKRQLVASDSYLPIFKFSTKFLEIPLAVHYDFNQNKPIYIPKIIIGMSKLIPIGSTIEDLDVSYQSSRYSITDFYKGIPKQTSFYVGIGVKKMLKDKGSIELNLKYAREKEDVTEEGRIYSDRFELSFNYLFALSKK